MASGITVKEAARRWGIPETQVTRYCRDGRIRGAVKESRSWHIPENAEKPSDPRKNCSWTDEVAKPLPVGISSYREVSGHYYYVDKTLLIRDFLDEGPKVSLFTRPRRFGKTLTMDMLKTFFELSDEDTSVYFQNRRIWACGERYRRHQGKYPVIFVTFKDVKFDTWEETFEAIRRVIAKEAARHPELEGSPKCDAYSRLAFQKLLSGTVRPGGAVRCPAGPFRHAAPALRHCARHHH